MTKYNENGKVLDGKYYFRSKDGQKSFDKLRNRLYIEDYGKREDGTFFFLYLNGTIEVYTRKQIINLYKDRSRF